MFQIVCKTLPFTKKKKKKEKKRKEKQYYLNYLYYRIFFL